MTDFDQLIDELSDDAAPVRVATSDKGRLGYAAVIIATLATVAVAMGFRPDVMAAAVPTQLLIALGLLLILAVAAGAGAVRMARPQVGAAASGAGWALAGVSTLLLAALVAILSGSDGGALATGWRCMAFGTLFGTAAFLFLARWLWRGAPVQPDRAGLLTGIAAGAVGALAISLECPRDAIAHLGIWHLAPIAIGALAGKLLLPRLLRW